MQKQQKQKLYALIGLLIVVAIAFLIKGIQKQEIVYFIISILFVGVAFTRVYLLSYMKKYEGDDKDSNTP